MSLKLPKELLIALTKGGWSQQFSKHFSLRTKCGCNRLWRQSGSPRDGVNGCTSIALLQEEGTSLLQNTLATWALILRAPIQVAGFSTHIGLSIEFVTFGLLLLGNIPIALALLKFSDEAVVPTKEHPVLVMECEQPSPKKLG